MTGAGELGPEQNSIRDKRLYKIRWIFKGHVVYSTDG